MTGTSEFVAVEPFAAAPAEEAAHERTLVERYRQMAHEFRPGPVDRALRMLDVVVGGALLAVASPLVLACALLVLVTSGRPLLYRGSRVGRNGHLFVMYKLRTLRTDAETRLEPFLGRELTRLTTSEMTRVGRLLRAWKLDELPQLWNVVRGEMSLVGPRPVRAGPDRHRGAVHRRHASRADSSEDSSAHGGRTACDVFVQTGGEQFARRFVEIAARDGDRVGIQSGVKPGERVVTRGAFEVQLASASTGLPAEGHVH